MPYDCKSFAFLNKEIAHIVAFDNRKKKSKKCFVNTNVDKNTFYLQMFCNICLKKCCVLIAPFILR